MAKKSLAGLKSAVFFCCRHENTAEEKRKDHQRELMHKMNEEALKRIKEGGDQKAKVKLRKAPVSYKTSGFLPREKEVCDLKIFVDSKYETVILPVFGTPVPFHIATLKNISASVEGDNTYLRINFFHPGAANIGKDGGMNFQTNPLATFVKELTYRSTNIKGRHLFFFIILLYCFFIQINKQSKCS